METSNHFLMRAMAYSLSATKNHLPGYLDQLGEHCAKLAVFKNPGTTDVEWEGTLRKQFFNIRKYVSNCKTLSLKVFLPLLEDHLVNNFIGEATNLILDPDDLRKYAKFKTNWKFESLDEKHEAWSLLIGEFSQELFSELKSPVPNVKNDIYLSKRLADIARTLR